MRVSATDGRVRPEDLLSPELIPVVREAVAKKKTETEERIERAKLRLADAEAANHRAIRERATSRTSVGRPGRSQKTESDIAGDLERRKVYRELVVAREALRAARVARRDLELLDRQAARGLRAVVTELHRRWSSTLMMGAEMTQPDPVSLARSLTGLGTPTNAIGPLERMQRRLRRQTTLRGELQRLYEEEQKRAQEEQKRAEAEERKRKRAGGRE